VNGLVHTDFEDKLFDLKVFVVTFVFSFVEGLHSLLSPYLPLLLSRIGYTTAEVGLAFMSLSFLYYVFNPILFFIVLYLVCSGKVLPRIASVLISLVFGSLLGFWLGGLSGAPLLASQIAETVSSVLLSMIVGLPFIPFGMMIFGFAVLVFSEMNSNWKAALPMEKLQSKRPFGVVVLSVLYVIDGLLNTLVLPVLVLYPFLLAFYPKKLLLLVIFVSIFVLGVTGQLLVAFGLYYGRKWGWVPALISSASSLFVQITFLLMALVFGIFKETPWITLGSLIGLVISLTVMLYLLSSETRKYFGFVNPPQLSTED
jgi:hypothetical protein